MVADVHHASTGRKGGVEDVEFPQCVIGVPGHLEGILPTSMFWCNPKNAKAQQEGYA